MFQVHENFRRCRCNSHHAKNKILLIIHLQDHQNLEEDEVFFGMYIKNVLMASIRVHEIIIDLLHVFIFNDGGFGIRCCTGI